MGDPETEVVMPRLDSDIVQHFAAVGIGTLANEQIKFNPRAACTVVVASGGYPNEYEKHKVIKGLPAPTEDTIVFHSGTKNSGHDIVTNGGRVLAVTSFGKDIADAVAKSNHMIERIQFDKKYYRKDIGYEFK
jgi:phosphoribosylamine--glycine ligase